MSAAAPQSATYSEAFRKEHVAGAAMWERMLEHVPTQLGKLVSVASFRIGISAEYRHPSLDRILSAELAHRVLRESHEQLFAEWVGLFPEEQSDDVNRYLASLRQETARELLLKASEQLIPACANAVARRAFLSDLAAILTAQDTPAANQTESWEPLPSVAADPLPA
jgi:hypothetical protein